MTARAQKIRRCRALTKGAQVCGRRATCGKTCGYHGPEASARAVAASRVRWDRALEPARQELRRRAEARRAAA